MNLYESLQSDYVYGPLAQEQVTTIASELRSVKIGGQIFIGVNDPIEALASKLIEKPVEVVDIAKLKEAQIKKVNEAYELAVMDLVKDTPSFERESWHKQESEAKDYLLNASSPTPYVDTLAESRGVPREILLSRILGKVSQYEIAHAQLTGKRQAKEDLINALPEDCTLIEVLSINWD